MSVLKFITDQGLNMRRIEDRRMVREHVLQYTTLDDLRGTVMGFQIQVTHDAVGIKESYPYVSDETAISAAECMCKHMLR